ncbi:ribosomal protein S30-domain-containing protein [Cyathus striatus]|nr:ribosomal protein S30-domain-containing protein [Cyathus striatus]
MLVCAILAIVLYDIGILKHNMGKVHGSLARAGKVKSQTPKVEKQEKKKTPKGRAKKRILYNRRFVNVTTLPAERGESSRNPNPEK